MPGFTSGATGGRIPQLGGQTLKTLGLLLILVTSVANLVLLLWLGGLVVGPWEVLPDEKGKDALSIALSLGRLDAITVLLAVIGIALVVGGVFSFTYFQERVESAARETARKVADNIARETITAHLNTLNVASPPPEVPTSSAPNLEGSQLETGNGNGNAQ